MSDFDGDQFDGEIFGANPIQIPAIYEKLVVAGELSPGVCDVTGFARSWDWDVKKAKGASGSSATLQGEPLAKGKVEFLLWLPEHFDSWNAFRELLVRGQQQKKIEALDVLHPVLTDLGIFSLVVEEIGQVTRKGRGLYSITVQFLEYRPPKSAGGSPNGSVGQKWKAGPGADGNPTTAQSQQDKELEVLLQEAQE